MKEVRFDIWCAKCVHKDKSEAEDPCYDCLADPANAYSRKPVHFEDGRKEEKR
jgi:hypothetical protein